MEQLYCEDCEKSTAGRCFKHSQYSFPVTPPLPVCIACGRVIEVNTPRVILPYGSRYDGDHLCSVCISASVDQTIDSLRAARGLTYLDTV